jgi:hypothetical protein
MLKKSIYKIENLNNGKILKTERKYPIRSNGGVPRDKQEILAFLFKREENVNAT